ncbi:hypothetical protein ACFLZB_00655 [Nanoarchaeota archaeon]
MKKPVNKARVKTCFDTDGKTQYRGRKLVQGMRGLQYTCGFPDFPPNTPKDYFEFVCPRLGKRVSVYPANVDLNDRNRGTNNYPKYLCRDGGEDLPWPEETNLIILPGNSTNNHFWSQELRSSLEKHFNTVDTLIYQHWEMVGDAEIDFDNESKVLETKATQQDSFVILAKSAGVILSLQAIQQGKINPQKCVYLGVPAKWADERGIDLNNLLGQYSVPTLFVQNTQDPMLSSKDLISFMGRNRIRNFELAPLPGDTHDYHLRDFQEKMLDFYRE